MTTFYHVDAEPDGYPTSGYIRTAYTDDVGNSMYGGTLPVRVIPYTAHGDYIGSLAERSNFEALQDDALRTDDEDGPGARDRLIELIGSHGFQALGWPAWCPLTRDLAEAIETLENYPVLDEERWSEIEAADAEGAWNDWARRDVARGVADWAGRLSEDLETAIDDLTDDDWAALWCAAEDGGNPLWKAEGCGVTFNVTELIRRVVAMIEGHDPRYVEIPGCIPHLEGLYLLAAGHDK